MCGVVLKNKDNNQIISLDYEGFVNFHSIDFDQTNLVEKF